METNKQRLPTIQRTITLDGQEYIVQGSANPFDSNGRRTFRAYVRNGLERGCSTISSIGLGQGLFGLVGTERDREQYEHLKGGSPERIAAVNTARAARADEAKRAIIAAFPEISYDAHTTPLHGEYELDSRIKEIA